jgi:hypothetical protein
MNESLELMSDDYPPPGLIEHSQEWLDRWAKSFDLATESHVGLLAMRVVEAPANYITLDFKTMPDGAHFTDVEQEIDRLRQRMLNVMGIPISLILP